MIDRVLGVFHGAVNLTMLGRMMEWQADDVVTLAGELITTGLATLSPHGNLTLNPALCPYLRGRMDATDREALTAHWIKVMCSYTEFLAQGQRRHPEDVAALTRLDLHNLFALLDLVQRAGNAETTIGLATSLYRLLQNAGKPRLLERLGHVREAATAALGGTWNHAQFQAAETRVEQQLASGRISEALDGAHQLLQRARLAGEQAYPKADYDLALACILMAQGLHRVGAPEKALPLLAEAIQRLEVVDKEHVNGDVKMIMFGCLLGQGNCLLDLGQLDEAATAYEEGIRRSEQEGADRNVALGKGQMGSVRQSQGRYQEALAAYVEAHERFTQLGEPISAAAYLEQIGSVYMVTGQPEAAEDAYRRSLATRVQFGDSVGQAWTLEKLGLLYNKNFGRLEEAASFFRQAADIYMVADNKMREGALRSNYASTLRQLCRLDEARQEILRGVECIAQFGHASEPWKAWSILADIEKDAGNQATATEAKDKAIAYYLAYRRDGSENHEAYGRIALAVTQSMLAGDQAQATSILQQQLPRFEAAGFGGFIRGLQSVIAGSCDRIIADGRDLPCEMAAEILLLIDTLEKSR